MKSGATIGVAVAAGYVLGRFHKMKWAMALATMAGRKRLPSGGMIQQGTKLVQSSPELSKLTDEIKGSLVEAGKTAAVAAVGSRINSLSEGLRERSESMRAASKAGAGRPSINESGDDTADESGDDTGDEERSRPRQSASRSRPDGDRRESRSERRPPRPREPEENGPRPKRRRPAEASAGQRRRRRETADE